MSQVLQTRSEIESLIAAQTLCTALEGTAIAHADEPAYSDKQGGDGWRTLTWAQVRAQALELAAGLVGLGLAPGDTVAIMAPSRIEHVLADLAAVHAGGVPMSIYATLAPEQVAFIAGQSRPAVVVLEGEDELRRWKLALEECESIRTVVVIDETAMPDDERYLRWGDLAVHGREVLAQNAGEAEARWKSIEPDQPLTVLYTSGTTGDPKGVVLTHHNILFGAEVSLRTSQLDGTGISISYLPFAHIAERMLAMYIPQIQGDHVHLIADPAELPATLAEVRPTRFFGVPRVWEKIQIAISAKLGAETDEAKKAGIGKALDTGLRYIEATQTGQQPSAELEAAYQAMDGAVLSHLRAAIGLDRVEWAASAAAPMPVDVTRFFAGLGIAIYDVYGMTETAGAVTANGPGSFRLGSVGRPHPGIEMRLAEDGEILVRGPLVTSGYLHQEEATRQLIDADGWVRTGDIGRLDEDGFFYCVDRKKELIITSSGKNIAPSNIEGYLKESPLVGHALAFGDNRPYVVAVLTLDADVAPLWARRFGVDFTDLADLCEKPEVQAAVSQAVAAANERLSRVEQVKRFKLLPVEWTAESEELTPTLKLRRRVVHAKYQDVLDGLYAG